jgi:hypothetical protein
MKRVLIILLVSAFCGLASAQGFRIGVAGDLTFPTGDFADASNSSGWGAEAFAVFDVALLTITARAGYMDFGSKDFDYGPGLTASTKTTAIPILAGLRWDFGLGVGPSFYAGVEAGVTTFNFTYETEGVTAPGDESTTEFTVSPNVGLTVMGFDLGAYYMMIKDANFWGLRLGYGFGF